MKNLLLIILIGLLPVCPTLAQNLLEEMWYPDTLRSSTDTFYMNSPQWKAPILCLINDKKRVDWGTYGYKGVHMEIYTDLDTLIIPHVNYPHRQWINIPIASPRDTTFLIARFQAANSNFSKDYIASNKGKISFEIPATYELANIILYLTDCSEKTGNRPEETAYIKKIHQHFAFLKTHPLVKNLNKLCQRNQHWSTYYGFRENSIMFQFEDGFLNQSTPYFTGYWDNSKIRGGQFRNLLYLVQDFANKSNFQQFYKDNSSYYQNLINRQQKLLPIQQMWDWLEKEFPQRMQHYKIIFSPLIGGSHSTQKYYFGNFQNPDYQECLMFINSPESLDQKDYAEKLKEGLMSGIVFTEIDHNYVNPTSNKFIKLIKDLISEKNNWAREKALGNYKSEYAIFNEYMTHGLFCLYVEEQYEEDIAKKIIEKRIDLMEWRGFAKFEAFYQKMSQIRKEKKQPTYFAYSDIIKAMNDL